MSIVANCFVIVFEIIGLYISISARHWKVLAFYTQISNMITLLSSVVLVVMSAAGPGTGQMTSGLRYLSSCMLAMTFLITLFVLVPMGGGFRKLMLSGNGLYHHTLCPAISITSYVLWEQHNTVLWVPVLVTFVYGLVMLLLNYLKKYDGPYPFFRVYDQSKTATVVWIIVMVGVIAAVSAGVAYVAP